MNDRYDVVVIGSGPAGEGAAMMAAKHHRSVAIVERYIDVGGGCTHWGTIPSKALRHAVQRINEIRSNPLFQEIGRHRYVTYPELLATANSVITQQVAGRRRFYERNHVPVISGDARFVSENTIEVQAPGREVERIEAGAFVIATGSCPYHPENVDFTHPRVLDSDSILHFDDTPKSITIYGAGVIGCEYASIFANMGIKVNLVNTQKRLMSFMDEEITEALSYHLRDQGVIIRHSEDYDAVETRDRDVVLQLKSGRILKSDVLLWANGRTGNSASLNLESVGLEANSRGQIEVDANYQTKTANIYAVGDIIGPPALASTAYDQGRFAATHIVTGKLNRSLGELTPIGIYTIPEISSVGKTEAELVKANVNYEVGHASFKNLARAQMTNETVGMLKIIFEVESLKVLGVHCFGDRATEIVHIGQSVMAGAEYGRNLRYFIDTTFNYPTMAEAYRVAALDGLNRLA